MRRSRALIIFLLVLCLVPIVSASPPVPSLVIMDYKEEGKGAPVSGGYWVYGYVQNMGIESIRDVGVEVTAY